MLHASTFLQTGPVGGVVLLLLGMIVITVALLFYLRKKPATVIQKSAGWLVRNDARIAQIVMTLSYFGPGSFKKKSFMSRKRIKLILEMRLRVKDHLPEASSLEIQSACRDLLILTQAVRKKRSEK